MNCLKFSYCIACVMIKIVNYTTMSIKDLTIVDDIHNVDRSDTLLHLHDNAMLSVSYIILLAISTVICTLGLLLDSPAIVIGGMIISPLMWPLMKISAGISLARQRYITQSLILLFFSVGISLASSFLITLVSPLKVISPEIIARTQPTLLDIVIALSAGTVAALAIVQKKISSSLAGVAIATSLMPPLCVGGIGLALLNPKVATGGLLLFVANVVSIIFVSIFVFRIVGIETHGTQKLQKNGILFVALMLIITAFPLFFFLKNYSFEAMAYQKAQRVLSTSLEGLSPSIYLENVKTRLEISKESGAEVIRVDADVLVPEDMVIDFKQKEAIITALENALNKNVILNLRVQKAIALQTETDIQTRRTKDQLTNTLMKEISMIDNSFSIDSISVYPKEDGSWKVNAVLRSEPSIQFTEVQRSDIESLMSNQVHAPVSLDLEIISRISLQGKPEILLNEIRTFIQSYFEDTYSDITVTDVAVAKRENEREYDVTMTVTVPSRKTINKEDIENLKLLLHVKYDSDFNFKVDQIEKQIYTF